MKSPAYPKHAALEALRRELGPKLRSGSELLAECERRDPPGVLAPVPPPEGDELGALLAGLRAGRLAEVLVPGPSRGGGLLLAALLSQARREGRYLALLDVGGGFVAEGLPERDLQSLLWVGCGSVEQAVAAFDVLARDENFHWILLDGRDATPEDWRAARPALWQRLSRQLRERGAVGVVLARAPVAAAAKDRHALVSRLALASLHEERAALAATLRVRPADAAFSEDRSRRRLAG
jgi:hypothetical protein